MGGAVQWALVGVGTGLPGNKKPRKTWISRGFSEYFGLCRNN